MSSTDLPSEPEIALAMPKLDISLPEMVGLTLQPGDSSMAADSITTASQPKLHITTLFDELLLEIFDLLIVESSVCLGLTCKKFYNIHKSIWGKVELLKPLDFWMTQTSEHIDIRLFDLLKDWMGHDMVFDYERRDPKFVNVEEFAARAARRKALQEDDMQMGRYHTEDDHRNLIKVIKTTGRECPGLLEWKDSVTGYEQLTMMMGTDLHSHYVMRYAVKYSLIVLDKERTFQAE